MKKNILKTLSSITLITVVLLCVSCSLNPQITMNPTKDAQTCIKLYEKDPTKGQAYMEEVITTYYMQGKNSECDKFSTIVAEKIAEMSFR